MPNHAHFLFRTGSSVLSTLKELVRSIHLNPLRAKIVKDLSSLNRSWAVREVGYGQAELARDLYMTQPGVGYAVRRGEKMAELLPKS